MSRRTKTRNMQHGTPSRSIRVPDKLWGKLDEAARVAGVSRNQFILGVCQHAAHQILSDERQKENDE